MFEHRIFNFAPGPATLPEEVLAQAGPDLLSWQGLGAGVLEVSHRGPAFMQCYFDAIQHLRDLMSIPQNYKILFLHGGAIGQNAAIPLNLMRLGKSGPQADFIISGLWTQKSRLEASKFGTARIAASSDQNQFRQIPERDTWDLSPDSAYVHLCDNETVGGVEFPDAPHVGQIPLVADFSSSILSKSIDVSQYGVIFAGAQKNIGAAGLTIVIVREDLLGYAMPTTPSIWDWQIQAQNDSMINTPCIFAIYIAGEFFKWLKKQGGIPHIEKVNRQKAQILYTLLDNSSLYVNHVDPRHRSKMNIPFFLKDESLNERFISQAAAAGLIGLKGHKSVGGMRASIYNAMSLAGIQSLAEFMQEFERLA